MIKIRWVTNKSFNEGHQRANLDGGKKKVREKMERQNQGGSLDFSSTERAVEDRQRWQKIVVNVGSFAPTTFLWFRAQMTDE